MPTNTPEYRREHYRKNKGQYLERNRRSRARRAEWARAFKDSLKCSACDEDYPAALEFHHVDPSQKDFEIGTVLKRGTFGLPAITRELAKCVCLCANCHRKAHGGVLDATSLPRVAVTA